MDNARGYTLNARGSAARPPMESQLWPRPQQPLVRPALPWGYLRTTRNKLFQALKVASVGPPNILFAVRFEQDDLVIQL